MSTFDLISLAKQWGNLNFDLNPYSCGWQRNIGFAPLDVIKM